MVGVLPEAINSRVCAEGVPGRREEGDVSEHIWKIKQKDKVIEIGPQVRGTKQEFKKNFKGQQQATI